MANERLRAQRLALGWSQEDVVRGLVRVGIEVGERQLGVTRNLRTSVPIYSTVKVDVAVCGKATRSTRFVT